MPPAPVCTEKNMRVTFLMLVCLPAIAAAADDGGEPLLVYPFRRIPAQKMTIDAVLDEQVWRQAVLVTGFVIAKANELASPQTLFKLLYDGDNLYLAAECLEPVIHNLSDGSLSSSRRRCTRVP